MNGPKAFSKHIKNFINPDLIHGGIFKSIFCFMIPIMVSYLFQQLYNTADTVIVGHFLQEKSLAAIGSCTPVFDLMLTIGNGFGTGCSIVIARAYGSGDRNYLKRSIAASIFIVIVISILLTVAGFFCLRPILNALKTPSSIIEESMSYITLVASFCGILFAYNLCAGMLRAIGNSFMPLVFLIISSLLNILLDILFITKLNTGVAGTAAATVIAQGFSVILCIIYILKGAKILVPSSVHFKFTGAARLYKELIGQGLSMALMMSIVCSGTIVLQSAINGFQTYIIAGHIAARKIFSLITVALFSIGMAASTFVSQNYGAGNVDRVKKGVNISVFMSMAYSFILTVLSPLIIPPVFAFVSGSKNEQVLEYGIRYLKFAFPFFIVLGPLVILRNSLQGLGAKILPLVSSFVELAGKILFTLFIIPKIGILGIILCEPLIWCFMTVQLVWAFAAKLKNLNKN